MNLILCFRLVTVNVTADVPFCNLCGIACISVLNLCLYKLIGFHNQKEFRSG